MKNVYNVLDELLTPLINYKEQYSKIPYIVSPSISTKIITVSNRVNSGKSIVYIILYLRLALFVEPEILILCLFCIDLTDDKNNIAEVYAKLLVQGNLKILFSKN